MPAVRASLHGGKILTWCYHHSNQVSIWAKILVKWNEPERVGK